MLFNMRLRFFIVYSDIPIVFERIINVIYRSTQKHSIENKYGKFSNYVAVIFSFSQNSLSYQETQFSF